jgi:hypothetical protein
VLDGTPFDTPPHVELLTLQSSNNKQSRGRESAGLAALATRLCARGLLEKLALLASQTPSAVTLLAAAFARNRGLHTLSLDQCALRDPVIVSESLY